MVSKLGHNPACFKGCTAYQFVLIRRVIRAEKHFKQGLVALRDWALITLQIFFHLTNTLLCPKKYLDFFPQTDTKQEQNVLDF